ncbi:MAG: transcriptional repressor LexA [Oscillibacter sp.]
MQQRVYDYIAESIAEHGYAPSVREVGEALGLKSPSTVHFHIKHLQEMGLIEKSAGKGRAITLKKQLQAVPVAPQPVEIDELAPRRRQVPILGNVAAGNPILAQECIEDYLTFDTGGHDDEYFALRVRGESMLGVGILPDDLVVVHRQNLAQNGQIVVALLGDEATVKTLKRKGSEVWLMPANPDYQPIDGRECTILAASLPWCGSIKREKQTLLRECGGAFWLLQGESVLLEGVAANWKLFNSCCLSSLQKRT